MKQLTEILIGGVVIAAGVHLNLDIGIIMGVLLIALGSILEYLRGYMTHTNKLSSKIEDTEQKLQDAAHDFKLGVEKMAELETKYHALQSRMSMNNDYID